jgi:hypothetical protein
MWKKRRFGYSFCNLVCTSITASVRESAFNALLRIPQDGCGAAASSTVVRSQRLRGGTGSCSLSTRSSSRLRRSSLHTIPSAKECTNSSQPQTCYCNCFRYRKARIFPIQGCRNFWMFTCQALGNQDMQVQWSSPLLLGPAHSSCVCCQVIKLGIRSLRVYLERQYWPCLHAGRAQMCWAQSRHPTRAARQCEQDLWTTSFHS